jgi:hypothetical protein
LVPLLFFETKADFGVQEDPTFSWGECIFFCFFLFVSFFAASIVFFLRFAVIEGGDLQKIEIDLELICRTKSSPFSRLWL